MGQSFLRGLSSKPVLTREGVLHVVGHYFEGLAKGLRCVLLLVSFRWIVIREVVTNGTVGPVIRFNACAQVIIHSHSAFGITAVNACEVLDLIIGSDVSLGLKVLLVLDALDVLILWVLLSVSIVYYSLHSSLYATFQQIFFLLASCSCFCVLFVLRSTSTSDGLVKPC